MVSLLFVAALAAGFGQAPASGQNGGNAALPDAAQQQPQPALTPEMRGDIFMARKMFREAIETYTEVVGKNPVVWNKIGIAYHQLSQLDKARKSYEQALKLRPDYAEAENNIGAVYHAEKSYRRAIGAYRKAIRITPDSAAFHMNLGTAYMARKMDKEAMAEYQAALKIDPDAFEHHGTSGTTLEQRAVEEKARFYYTWAKVYASRNQTDLALQYLRRALEEGFKDRKKLDHDAEFNTMRESPAFKELMALEPRVL